MGDLLQRLKQRKLVQWALAYIAAVFALIQVIDVEMKTTDPYYDKVCKSGHD